MLVFFRGVIGFFRFREGRIVFVVRFWIGLFIIFLEIGLFFLIIFWG